MSVSYIDQGLHHETKKHTFLRTRKHHIGF